MMKRTTSCDPSAPLPDLRSMADAIRAALTSLLPPARITVPEAATRRKIDAGGDWIDWSNDVVPYMIEPQEMVGSRLFDSVCFVGPARSAKTEAMIMNPLVHMILASPRLVHILHMGKNEAQEFSIQEIDRLIRNSPELAERLATGMGSNNVFSKRFRGGGRLTIGWPVVSQLSGRSIPLVLITDYDRIKEDIDGEGSGFALGRKRTTAHQTRGMTVVEASPGREILDESWRPKTPHEAPPCTGILSIYNAGTRGRYYWKCKDCGGEFEPSLERLNVPEEGTNAERGAATTMTCLHCGSVIDHKHKPEFNRAGRWLHEAPDGSLVPMGDGVRKATTASYWLMGAASAFASWERIITNKLDAEEMHDRTGDETVLKGVINTDFGLPYLPRARGISASLSEQVLRDSATDHPWKVAPRGTHFSTVAVDVQKGMFVVQVEAWAEGLERYVIDRFEIHEPPDTAPRSGDRRIDPALYAEDWDVLLPLIDLEYEVATEDRALHPVAVIVDSRGESGVTANAYDFWRRNRRKHSRRFWIVQGVPGDRAKRAEIVTPESASRGKKFIARDVKIVKAGGDRLKDEVVASLLREDEGVRALHIPAKAPPEIFAEYAAERRTEKGWEKKPGQKRNEALDLSVYALALVIAVLRAETIKDWENPPAWAHPDPAINPFTVKAKIGGKEATATVDPPQKSTRQSRRRSRPRFDGWG